jgi:hypothetical protein
VFEKVLILAPKERNHFLEPIQKAVGLRQTKQRGCPKRRPFSLVLTIYLARIGAKTLNFASKTLQSRAKTLQSRAKTLHFRPKTLQNEPFCNENTPFCNESGVKTLQFALFCNENEPFSNVFGILSTGLRR